MDITIIIPTANATNNLITMNTQIELENDDRKPKLKHMIFDKMRTGFRPYLSPKYPPIMLPNNSPMKIV